MVGGRTGLEKEKRERRKEKEWEGELDVSDWALIVPMIHNISPNTGWLGEKGRFSFVASSWFADVITEMKTLTERQRKSQDENQKMGWGKGHELKMTKNVMRTGWGHFLLYICDMTSSFFFFMKERHKNRRTCTEKWHKTSCSVKKFFVILVFHWDNTYCMF